MYRGNDLTEAMKRQNAQSGEVVEGSSQGTGVVTGPGEVSPVPQQSPAVAQLTQSPLQHFMVTGQVQQVQVQNVTLANPQQVTSARAGQPHQLLAGMMVVPQLSPTAGFQQVVTHNPAMSTSGHGATTTLLLTQAPPDVPTSTVSASGGTIHHHGRSPTRGVIPPLANPVQHQSSQQNLMASMNLQQQLAAAGASPAPQTPTTSPALLASPVSNQPQAGAGSSAGAIQQGQQTIRRLSSVGSLSPAVSPQRTSPLLAFGQLQGSQRTSPMQSPERVRKRIKLEEVPPSTTEIASHRKLICDEKIRQMKEIKENYNEHLTELFFLQNGGNSMDYHACKKRPTVQLLHFLKSGNLDSDDDEEIPVGTETKINDEKKTVLTGIKALASPTSVLSPSCSTIEPQGNTDPGKKLGGRHGMVFGHVQPSTVQQTLPQLSGRGTAAVLSSPTTPVSTPQPTFSLVVQSTTATVNVTTTTTTITTMTKTTPATLSPTVTSPTSVTTSSITSQLAKVMAEAPIPAPTAAATTVLTTVAATKSVLHSVATTPTLGATITTTTTPSSTASGSLPAIKSPTRPTGGPHGNRFATRQHSISGYDGALGSQEAIVERAKQEAQVMQRVAELRKEGLWSSRRLPKVQEPPRNKAHWDYLLEEMQWLAADFAQERKWKKTGAKKIARMITKYWAELQQKELRAEKEEAGRTRRIASNMAKMVKEFWSNIEKVVQYKQQSRLEEKRKKALDLHLSFIVDQTEKYSSWLTEGLQAAGGHSSIASSSVPASPRSMPDDGDFQPDHSESDDEETIAKAEQELPMDESAQQEELTELERESTMPIDELINSLPKEILEKPASLEPSEQDSEEQSEQSSVKDEEYNGSDESEEDDEDTIAAQERRDRKTNHKEELADLEADGNLTMEELYKKYAAAYSEDFEAQLSDKSTDVESDEDSDEEVTEEEEEEEEEEEDNEGEEEEEVGVEYLFNPEIEEKMELDEQPKQPVPAPVKAAGDKSPGKDITDIAATALSLQPTGYTLETTRVITPVPFLLKGSLREYQHVGLDWLATMHDRKLNGILADEMGLGKTIQTIALLAHLACEKGVWGPHLIVVPTSVMLNWEMELKKWCPAFKILTYYGSQKERKAKRTGWTKTNAFHVCITSYKLVIQDHQAFRRKKWKYFILDEAQNIKNFKSQRWQTLLNFQSQRRLLLTGTPLQNSLMELWSLMHFLMPHVFASHREFKEWFSNPLTGMVEGSREYNENLIKRLHKVLRPFLLRRLKADVEKQMPKKYEHVVMCRLSKRQRYLYDDFMAQSKTKETLASGHFMSVINILMQLRKVCNHPNLFDPRPVISSFQQEGLSYTAASLVLRGLEKNALDHLSPNHLHPNLADLELTLPAFAAHRVRKLQTPRPLIKEVDHQPPPSPRPKGLQKPLKLDLAHCQSPLIQGQTSSPKASSRPGSPVTGLRASTLTTSSIVKPVTATPPTQTSTTPSRTVVPPTRVVTPMQIITTTGAVTTPAAVTTTQLVQLPGHTLTTASLAQARMVSSQPQSTLAMVTSSPGSNMAQSMPITVQIHQTQAGTRLMIPSGQLSQLPAGFLQIVQTPNGPQLIATQQPTHTGQAVHAATVGQPVTNGPTITTLSTASPTNLPSTTTQVVRTTTPSRPGTSLNLPTSSVTSLGGKPMVRVSPLAQSTTTATTTSATTSVVKTHGASTATTDSSGSTPNTATVRPLQSSKTLEKLRQSPFFLEDLYEKRTQRRADTLERIVYQNKRHCEVKPVYGQDLFKAVNIYTDYNRNCDKTRWKSLGYLHCQDVHVSSHSVADQFWRQTQALDKIVHTPEQYLYSIKDTLKRFVFYIPTVTAPCLRMHASHPPPSLLNQWRMMEHRLHRELSPKTALLHPISTNMKLQCPEARLIQYDCGKLQTLDLLLRELKSGQHRVLIFTQMTKMLDVLEAFLNYHGHRYLRLDGTTHIEQRQILMDRFNMDKRIFVFILSTRSGGIGVNLTGADTVVFYDSDWNPTMDAQAQDRCHRIGQTRDVHIYRLISERTVEENILKKANQKRLLGDVAIEGGNFTTAYFQDKTIKELFTEKENTVKELFAEPSGLHQLAKDKEQRRERAEEKERQLREVQQKQQQKEEQQKESLNTSMTQEQIEEALAKAEDETDVQAAQVVAAEQKAELAEFDENIPWDEREEANRREEQDESKLEQELAMLEKELTSVERYAVVFMEGQMSPLQEELERAEEEVTLAKEEWELTRLKALRQEEERRAELEEDEMLFTYSRHDAYNQVKKKPKKNALKKDKSPMTSTPGPQVAKGSNKSVSVTSEYSMGSSPESESSRKSSRTHSRRSSVNSQTSSTSVGSSKSGRVKEEGKVKVERVGKREKGDGDGLRVSGDEAGVRLNGPGTTPLNTKVVSVRKMKNDSTPRVKGEPKLKRDSVQKVRKPGSGLKLKGESGKKIRGEGKIKAEGGLRRHSGDVKAEVVQFLSPSEEKKIMTRARNLSGEVLSKTPTGMMLRKPLAINIHSDHGLVSLPMVTSPKQRLIISTPGSPKNKTPPVAPSTPNALQITRKDTSTPKAPGTPLNRSICTPPTVSPIVPQPWSKPNLVIRTRRASAKEAKKPARLQDGERPKVEAVTVVSQVVDQTGARSASSTPVIVTSSAPKAIKVPLTSVVGGRSTVGTSPIMRTINSGSGAVSVINSAGGINVLNSVGNVSLVNTAGSIIRPVVASTGLKTNVVFSSQGNVIASSGTVGTQQVRVGPGTVGTQQVRVGPGTVGTQQVRVGPGTVGTQQVRVGPGTVGTQQVRVTPGTVGNQQVRVSPGTSNLLTTRTIATTSGGTIRLVQSPNSAVSTNGKPGMVLVSGSPKVYRTSTGAIAQVSNPNNTVPILEKMASQMSSINNVAMNVAATNPSSNTVPILEKMAMQLQGGYSTVQTAPGGVPTTRPQQIIIVQSRPQQQQQTLIQQPAKVVTAGARPQQVFIRTQAPAAAGGATRPQQVYIHTRQGGQQVLVPIQTLTGSTGNTISLATLQNLQARSQVSSMALTTPRASVAQTVTTGSVTGIRPQTITVPISALQGRTASGLQAIRAIQQGTTNFTLAPRQAAALNPVRQTIIRHPQQFIVHQPGKQPQQVILQPSAAQQLLLQQAKQGQHVVLQPRQQTTTVATSAINSVAPTVRILSTVAAAAATPTVTNVTIESLDNG